MSEVGVGRNAVHVHAQFGEFRLEIGQVFQFGWANEGEVGWVEHEDGPLALQRFFAQVNELAIVVSGCFEWFYLGVNERHCGFLVRLCINEMPF
ncbi:hypothetical protein D3C72_2143650 [compost metagenome]